MCIRDRHIPSELTTIANQEIVEWKGEKIASNEELEATLDNPSHLEEYTAYYGTLNESRDGVSFKMCIRDRRPPEGMSSQSGLSGTLHTLP